MPEPRDSLSTILSEVRAKAAPPPPEDAEELTVAQMDGRYSAMRPANKNLTRLHVILRDGRVRSFQYHFLDVLSTFDGREFVLVFAGARHWELRVRGYGPGFWAIYDYCSLHRWPYLREATRDVADRDETVLTEIKITDVTPKRED